jgi:hypothetical protein
VIVLQFTPALAPCRSHEEVLVSVGTSSLVTHWDLHLSRGAITARGQATSAAPALFAALSLGDMLFVGGAAPFVDVFLTPSSRTFSLQL